VTPLGCALGTVAGGVSRFTPVAEQHPETHEHRSRIAATQVEWPDACGTEQEDGQKANKLPPGRAVRVWLRIILHDAKVGIRRPPKQMRKYSFS
jgi:hypothetical protein